jgi:hypothetical protein
MNGLIEIDLPPSPLIFAEPDTGKEQPTCQSRQGPRRIDMTRLTGAAGCLANVCVAFRYITVFF